MSSTTLIISFLFAASVVGKPIQSLQSRATVAIPGYDYVGCYTDTVAARTFTSKSYFDDAMTIEKCAAACSGYTWFGLEYGRECFCGDAPKAEASKVQEAYCSFSCPGDSSQTCGAGDHLTTYAKTGTAVAAPVVVVPTTFGSLGCYTEASSGRALGNAVFYDDAMTVELCAKKCAGFSFFGLEYTKECWCGNELRQGSIKISKVECPYTCPGDRTQSCGGDNRLDLYKFGVASVPETVETKYARQGCYTEAYTSPLGQGRRSLTSKQYFDDEMTVEKCSTACSDFTWFGLEYGRECYCGVEVNAGSVVTDDAKCSFACPGDGAQKCGAGDLLDMYKFGASEVLPSTTSSASVVSSTVSSSTTTTSPSTASESSLTTTTTTTTSEPTTSSSSSTQSTVSPTTTESSSSSTESSSSSSTESTVSPTTTESSSSSTTTVSSTSSKSTTTESSSSSSTQFTVSPTTTEPSSSSSTTTVSSTSSEPTTTSTSTTTTSPSPTTTTTTTTTTTSTTSAMPIPTCLLRASPFKAQINYNNQNLQMYANLVNQAGGFNWQAISSSSSAAVQNKYIWSLDANGYLRLAYNVPPYSYEYFAYMLLPDSTRSSWPQVDTKAFVDNRAKNSPTTYSYVKGCVDSVTGELKLDAGGRKNILWCGNQMWMSFTNGEDINRGVCVRVYPQVLDV